jgi:hypothetical protein
MNKTTVKWKQKHACQVPQGQSAQTRLWLYIHGNILSNRNLRAIVRAGSVKIKIKNIHLKIFIA